MKHEKTMPIMRWPIARQRTGAYRHGEGLRAQRCTQCCEGPFIGYCYYQVDGWHGVIDGPVMALKDFWSIGLCRAGYEFAENRILNAWQQQRLE